VHALGVLGGVPTGKVRYDNLKAAVAQVVGVSRSRVENQRWVAFRSHFSLDVFYCRPGKDGAHEKGGVEGEVGRFRHNRLVPVPQVASLAELNAMISEWDVQDDLRRIGSRVRTVGEYFAVERPLLQALPAEPFETSKVFVLRVDRKSQITVRTIRYSLPVRLIGRRVRVLLHSSQLVVFDGKTEVARHERLIAKGGSRLELDHYLEVLVRKPGALPGATALEQARQGGRFTPVHDAWWAAVRKARRRRRRHPGVDRGAAAAPDHDPRARGRRNRRRVEGRSAHQRRGRGRGPQSRSRRPAARHLRRPRRASGGHP
jgi:hypothetical protein